MKGVLMCIDDSWRKGGGGGGSAFCVGGGRERLAPLLSTS